MEEDAIDLAQKFINLGKEYLGGSDETTKKDLYLISKALTLANEAILNKLIAGEK